MAYTQLSNYMFPLDLVPGACFGVSFRLLTAKYKKALINCSVNTNTTTYSDIGWAVEPTIPPDTNSVAGIAANMFDFDWASLVSVAGTGNAFLQTWYDQSGFGNDAINYPGVYPGNFYRGSYATSFYKVGTHIAWTAYTSVTSSFQASVKLPTTYVVQQPALSIVAVFYYSTLPGGNLGRIFDCSNGLYLTGDAGTLAMGAGSNITGGTITAATSYVAVGVYNTTTSVGYLNGSQVCSGAVGAATIGGNIYIGRHNYAGSVISGNIGELFIYPFALTAAQVTLLTNNIRTFWGF